MTSIIGTFEYRGCPGASYAARERVIGKLNKIDGVGISFGYMLNDDNETLGVRLTVTGDEALARDVAAIAARQKTADFRSSYA